MFANKLVCFLVVCRFEVEFESESRRSGDTLDEHKDRQQGDCYRMGKNVGKFFLYLFVSKEVSIFVPARWRLSLFLLEITLYEAD